MPQSRRLLATLSSIPTSSPSSTFVPPYAHATPSSSLSNTQRTLKAPYRHSNNAPSTPSPSLAPTYDYSVQSSLSDGAEERWSAWAREVLASPSGAVAVWKETLEKLANIKDTDAPEVSAIDVPLYLKDEAKVARIKEAGSLVVRDAVPDHVALGWARDVAKALRARGGDATYWHPALLAARANPSLLSTLSTVMSALSPYNGHEAFLQAEAVREGLDVDQGVMDFASPWTIDESVAPASPILSALALTPSATPLGIFSSILSAVYASLRPLFQPVRSKMSFYSSAEYLSADNWQILAPGAVPLYPSNAQGTAATGSHDHPHLAPSDNIAVSLNPGDLILHHPQLPIQSPPSQAFLPLTLLPNTSANTAYIQRQRDAYEQGLPPSSIKRDGGRAVRVEKTQGRAGVLGWRGKKVMGY